MDAVGVVLVGVGGWLLYAAVKNEHPWQQLTTLLSGGGLTSGSGSSIPGSVNAGNTPGWTGNSATGNLTGSPTNPSNATGRTGTGQQQRNF